MRGFEASLQAEKEFDERCEMRDVKIQHRQLDGQMLTQTVKCIFCDGIKTEYTKRADWEFARLQELCPDF